VVVVVVVVAVVSVPGRVVSVPAEVVDGVVLVALGAKPHFLPLLLGAAFLWARLPFAGHGLLWLFGTPPLSAELRTGKAPAIPRQVTNTASLRVLNFTS
jgi:hypothetical protein